jgi:hypothetical protein
MNPELIFKAASLLVAVAGAGRFLYDVSIGRRGRMREEYKFAKEFLSDINSDSGLHPFLREKGYHAIAGGNSISGDEIEYLLALTRPDRALKDYVAGRHYLEHFPRSGNLQIEFKKKYKSKFSRKWRLYGYLILYLLLGFMAFSPLVLSGFYHTSPSQTFGLLLTCIGVFGPYALFSLRSGYRLHRAQMLVSHQNKHTQRIILPASKS